MHNSAPLERSDTKTGGLTIRTGNLAVNLENRLVTVDGNPVRLTSKEYRILELLCLRKGTILTKEMFPNHLYGGMHEPELKIIDVFVCKLRKKADSGDGRFPIHRYDLGSRLCSSRSRPLAGC